MSDQSVTVAPTKKPWESKTLWTNTILTLSGLFIPAVKEYLTGHPEVFTLIFGGVNIALRLITAGAISLQD